MFRSHRIGVRTLAMLLLPVVFLAESAAASSPLAESPRSVKVRYRDLNLETPQGVAGLYARIHDAAAIVCESSEGPQLVNRVFWTDWNFCVNHAVADAVQAVHNDNLSAYHWKHIRGPKHYWVQDTTTLSAR
jgi:UrcA family protein